MTTAWTKYKNYKKISILNLEMSRKVLKRNCIPTNLISARMTAVINPPRLKRTYSIIGLWNPRTNNRTMIMSYPAQRWPSLMTNPVIT